LAPPDVASAEPPEPPEPPALPGGDPAAGPVAGEAEEAVMSVTPTI